MSTIDDFAARLGPLIDAVSPASRPRLLATLERGAAQRYRAWAASAPDVAEGDGLRACAAREEEIATRVEALFPVEATTERDIAGVLPEIARVYGAALAGRPVVQQYAIQAAAERRGAGLWRAFAAAVDEAPVRDALLACAGLEERSAEFLESLVGVR